MTRKSIALPKDFSKPIAAVYSPKDVESKWSEWWEAQGFYKVDASEAKEKLARPGAKKFVMVIPPPNITGSLHLGHTLTNAVQDALTRWHRMRGDVSLWIPGVDHAGIATQSVVERQIYKNENLTRHHLGRESFLKRVWEWKEKHGSRICYQLRRLGASPDWSREFFTMDENLTKAVGEAFVQLFERGLIYRETRLVCWCPFLKTALSDIEVETEEIEKPTRVRIPGYERTVEVGTLWVFKYQVKPIENSSDNEPKFIEVATTRIETMLGDVAVAVNPKDARYKSLVGRELIHPFFPEREIRVIADDYVDIDFGTGAVKITPAHDRNDYEVAKRHDLPAITIFTDDGRISSNGGEFAGQHRFDCRYSIEVKLKELNLLVEKKNNTKTMNLPRCSRSNDIVEYMLLPQWWMKCSEVAKEAVQAVKTKQLKIIPEAHEQTWFYWLENVRDWCISRQLWWGHRIPAYKVVVGGASEREFYVAARDADEARAKAERQLHLDAEKTVVIDGSSFSQPKTPAESDVANEFIVSVEQDADVLDTWFSAALVPFSSLGWPDQTPDLTTFFPTSLLETGHDILFFWVARMVMMSLLLLKRLPFSDVLLHAMVRDAHGKKMSKSLGNVVDPIEVIEGISLDAMLNKLKDGNLPPKEIARAADAQRKDFPKGIPECGADALRFGLLAYTSQSRSINLDVNRVVAYRCFCNKLWNAVKFALLNFPNDFNSRPYRQNCQNPTPTTTIPPSTDEQHTNNTDPLLNPSSLETTNSKIKLLGHDWEDLQFMDRWILSRLSYCADKTNHAFENYHLADVVTRTYNFWLYELCDIYLELLKPRFTGSGVGSSSDKDKAIGLDVLLFCLDWGLRLLHPTLPFVTEELYHRLPIRASDRFESISIAEFPERVPLWHQEGPSLEEQMNLVMRVVREFRSLMMTLELDPKKKFVGYLILNETASSTEIATSSTAEATPSLWISTGEAAIANLKSSLSLVRTLTRLEDVVLVGSLEDLPFGCVHDVVDDRASIGIDVKGLVNFGQVLSKVTKKIEANEKQIDGYRKRMAATNYKEKVPLDVQQTNAERLEQLLAEKAALQNAQKMVQQHSKE